MKCPECSGGNTMITDSRDAQDGTQRRRRRQCASCGHRWSTLEIIEEQYEAVMHAGEYLAHELDHVRATLTDVINRVRQRG